MANRITLPVSRIYHNRWMLVHHVLTFQRQQRFRTKHFGFIAKNVHQPIRTHGQRRLSRAINHLAGTGYRYIPNEEETFRCQTLLGATESSLREKVLDIGGHATHLTPSLPATLLSFADVF